jgi:hypothetical protein
VPPEYQRLAGPWVNGRDPNAAAGAGPAPAGGNQGNNR